LTRTFPKVGALATFTVSAAADAGTAEPEAPEWLLLGEELQAPAPRARTARTAMLTSGRDRPSLIVFAPLVRSRFRSQLTGGGRCISGGRQPFDEDTDERCVVFTKVALGSLYR
jgi:hypothetical protein